MAPAAAVEGAVKDIAVPENNTEGGAMKAAVEGEYLYRSKLPDIDIPDNLPVHDYCFQHIEKFANNPCLIDGATERVWTYAEVELNSRKVAAGLTASGVKSGDVVMLLVQNCVEFAFTFLGASMIGAIVTTANPFYTPGEIAKQAAGSNARIVVTHAAFTGKLQGLDNISAIYTIDGPVPEGCKAFSELLDADEEKDFPRGIRIDPSDVVALPYSSGTTGLPKGVKLSHRGLVASIAQLADGENPNLYFNSEDVLLCVLPLFHIYCLHTVLLCALRVGSAMVIMPKFNITSMLQYIDKYKISILPIVPPIVVEITKCDQIVAEKVSSVRMIICGGAPLAKEIEAELRERFPRVVFGQGYGMTEAGPVLAMNLAFAKHPFPVKSGSCGTVVRNAQVKIIDTETGVSLPHNKPGEICIRGPEIMIGYLNDDEATEETIDKEGWLHTGDVGYIDDNEELFIVDRVKEIIKYKGFQVAPAEIEALLMQHPSISKAAVVPEKHELAGEVPVAFVVRSDGNEISEQEIKAYLEKKVIFYKRIHRVIFTDSIPIAPSGKILRKDLKARLQQAASA